MALNLFGGQAEDQVIRIAGVDRTYNNAYIQGSARQRRAQTAISTLRTQINGIQTNQLENELLANCGPGVKQVSNLDRDYNNKMFVVSKLNAAVDQLAEGYRPKFRELIAGLADAILEESHEAYRRVSCGLLKKRTGLHKRQEAQKNRLDYMMRCCFGSRLQQMAPQGQVQVAQGAQQNPVNAVLQQAANQGANQ